jgi:hypothetical protein
MYKDQKTPSFRQVIVHTVMGAVLGALLALALIVTNRHLFELIAHFPSPGFPLAQLIGVSSFLIAAGATLSGLIFTTVEINSPPAKRRIISPPDKRGDSEK